uniref:Uncharacterized protein n=1 Tax=Branchiostoma floridae TaxID=7739 RepID=C3YK39_BRAFL|eukprot:XP_002603485.1 hypothetical protein BRAFLDRAFT_79019 [Branchiostoma floridae]
MPLVRYQSCFGQSQTVRRKLVFTPGKSFISVSSNMGKCCSKSKVDVAKQAQPQNGASMYKPPKEHRPKSVGKSHNKVKVNGSEKPAASTFNSSTELKQTNLPPLPTTPGGSPRGRYFHHIPTTAFQCPPPENASMAARACGYSSNLHRLHSDPACLREEDPMADPINCEYRYQLTLTSLVKLRPLERGFHLPNYEPINTPYIYYQNEQTWREEDDEDTDSMKPLQ